MSLATRCSACGTVFRVVQDQLKVSEGWVRCGRCNEVFNALEGLFDLDREAPPEWGPQERDEWATQAPSIEAAKAEEAGEGREERVAADPQLVDRIDSQLFGTRAANARQAADAAAPDAGPHPPMGTDDGLLREPGFERNARLDDDDDLRDDAPDFLRRAERAQRWDRPWVRAVLGIAALALSTALGVQAAHHFRDEVVARLPEAAPALTAWCAMVGCSVGAPRRIDDVAVESTALSRVGTADSYRLSIVLRNHGSVSVATPSVDLALTDANGQLIARRAVSMREFATAPERLAPGGDANLQAILSAGANRITGYTVELFYP